MNKASCDFEVLTGLDSTATLIISRLTHIGLQFARELGRRRSKKKAEVTELPAPVSGHVVVVSSLAPGDSALVEVAGGSADSVVYRLVEAEEAKTCDVPCASAFVPRISAAEHCAGGSQDEQAVAEVVQPGLSHARGYNDFGGDRKAWSRWVAIDKLVIGRHQFAQPSVDDPTASLECLRCWLEFPPSKLSGLARSDVGCKGVLLTVGSGPLAGPQARTLEFAGDDLDVRGLLFHHSHTFRHFCGAVWCHRCGGIFNLMTAGGKGGAPLLKKACRNSPASKPYAAGLVQIAELRPPGHLTGGWPGADNLRLEGFA
jgi:hypothetical protein